MFYFLDALVSPFTKFRQSFNSSTVIGAITIAVILVIIVAVILTIKIKKGKK